MAIETKLQKLAASILLPDSRDNIESWTSVFDEYDAKEWMSEVMGEAGVRTFRSGQIYGSSQGPDIGLMIQVALDESKPYDNDIQSLKVYLSQIAEKKFPDYHCYIVLEDNCLFLVAIPTSSEFDPSFVKTKE